MKKGILSIDIETAFAYGHTPMKEPRARNDPIPISPIRSNMDSMGCMEGFRQIGDRVVAFSAIKFEPNGVPEPIFSKAGENENELLNGVVDVVDWWKKQNPATVVVISYNGWGFDRGFVAWRLHAHGCGPQVVRDWREMFNRKNSVDLYYAFKNDVDCNIPKSVLENQKMDTVLKFFGIYEPCDIEPFGVISGEVVGDLVKMDNPEAWEAIREYNLGDCQRNYALYKTLDQLGFIPSDKSIEAF